MYNTIGLHICSPTWTEWKRKSLEKRLNIQGFVFTISPVRSSPHKIWKSATRAEIMTYNPWNILVRKEINTLVIFSYFICISIPIYLLYHFIIPLRILFIFQPKYLDGLREIYTFHLQNRQRSDKTFDSRWWESSIFLHSGSSAGHLVHKLKKKQTPSW